jgi:hypothetical protein
MNLPGSHELTKRPSSQKALTPPSKRLCTSSSAALPPPKQPLSIQSIESILNLPEDVVWSLRKQDLRTAFLALQKYALSPYPFSTPTSTDPTNSAPDFPVPAPLAAFLSLPLEIREMIYGYLLSPPSSTPIRGPHPRQLQTNICLSQSFPPSLLLLNHQIRQEALPIMYGSPTQTVFVTVDYNIWDHKTRRSDLVLSSALTSAMKQLHLSIHLGSEKRNNKPGDVEADARITEVKKGIKKLRTWLAGADIHSLKISWQEPPQTYTWEQKREVLDGLRAMRAVKVVAGEINWGLNWNKGRKFRFEVEYFKELERGCRRDAITAEREMQK